MQHTYPIGLTGQQKVIKYLDAIMDLYKAVGTLLPMNSSARVAFEAAGYSLAAVQTVAALEEPEPIVLNDGPYPAPIYAIAHKVVAEIHKYYPEAVNLNFDNFGFPATAGSKAIDRAAMCIYIELLKAGAFSNDTEKK